jgi:hypothetical protein
LGAAAQRLVGPGPDEREIGDEAVVVSEETVGNEELEV